MEKYYDLINKIKLKRCQYLSIDMKEEFKAGDKSFINHMVSDECYYPSAIFDKKIYKILNIYESTKPESLGDDELDDAKEVSEVFDYRKNEGLITDAICIYDNGDKDDFYYTYDKNGNEISRIITFTRNEELKGKRQRYSTYDKKNRITSITNITPYDDYVGISSLHISYNDKNNIEYRENYANGRLVSSSVTYKAEDGSMLICNDNTNRDINTKTDDYILLYKPHELCDCRLIINIKDKENDDDEKM